MCFASRLSDMSENYLHTLESVIPYLTTDQVLEILQINTAVLITSDTTAIPKISGKYDNQIVNPECQVVKRSLFEMGYISCRTGKFCEDSMS